MNSWPRPSQRSRPSNISFARASVQYLRVRDASAAEREDIAQALSQDAVRRAYGEQSQRAGGARCRCRCCRHRRDIATSPETSHDDPPHKAKPGHGRNGAEAYRNAPVVEVALSDPAAGQACPQCESGRVYAWPPKTIVKVTGQPPLGATVYKLEQRRCRMWDARFTASMPEGLTAAPKYDESCASILALLRYGSGMPFFRLEGLQDSLNVPLPGPQAAFEKLTRRAAQAELLHNDDTPARILSLINERTRIEAAGKEPESKAINTSGIVAVLREPERELKVVLFFAGHAHAGNNLAAHRAA